MQVSCQELTRGQARFVLGGAWLHLLLIPVASSRIVILLLNEGLWTQRRFRNEQKVWTNFMGQKVASSAVARSWGLHPMGLQERTAPIHRQL